MVKDGRSYSDRHPDSPVLPALLFTADEACVGCGQRLKYSPDRTILCAECSASGRPDVTGDYEYYLDQTEWYT